MSTYEDREGHGRGFIHYGPLIEAAERHARVGERTFWNWFQTLIPDERRQVEHHMQTHGRCWEAEPRT